MTITIREWSRTDLPQMCKDWLDFCSNVTRTDLRFTRDAENDLLQWLRSRFRDPASFGLIAQYQGNYAGFLLARVTAWESDPPIVGPRKLGIVDAVYASKDFRRQGIARHLIERALARMRQKNAIAVEVIHDAGDEGSMRMWRDIGFKPWMVHSYRML